MFVFHGSEHKVLIEHYTSLKDVIGSFYGSLLNLSGHKPRHSIQFGELPIACYVYESNVCVTSVESTMKHFSQAEKKFFTFFSSQLEKQPVFKKCKHAFCENSKNWKVMSESVVSFLFQQLD